MLSLNQSIQKINEEEAARLAAARELSAAADAAAEYAVEVDPRETGQFREHLRNLSEQLSRQPSHDSLQSARHNFQTELRQYSAHASKEVRRLKQDLHAAAQAMQSFAQGISTGAHEHEALLRQEFEQLTRASDQDDLPALRATVRQTVAAVTASYQELRQAHNLVIAQLRDEIRTLQQTVERQSNSATPAPPTLLERRVLDQHLEEKLRARQGFHLLLARPCHPDHPKVPDAVRLHAHAEFVKGLRALAGAAPVAEWSSDAYAVLLAAPLRDLARWEQQLAACHLFQHEGLPRTLRTTANLRSIEFASPDSPSLFYSRLSDASKDLGC